MAHPVEYALEQRWDISVAFGKLVKDLEEIEENLNDVCVEHDGTQNVFFGR